MSSYLIGFDIGSSSVKASLVNADTSETIRSVHYPPTEMDVVSRQKGWAEQNPELWWENVCNASEKLLSDISIDVSKIIGIGLSYQMHGLVLVDENYQVLRPSIIWSDSRAVEIGNKAFIEIGEKKCLDHLMNSPGNFTMSKLKWVFENEPEIYEQVHKFMLPGDFIAMKMTGRITSTIPGMSEAMLWDFKNNKIADFVLQYFGFDQKVVPEILPTFSIQGNLTPGSAKQLGLCPGIPIAYRAGDQPNNAMSLNVFNPGEIAATGGTSGVVYAVVDHPVSDEQSRVNGFAHVNYTKLDPKIGVLLCINGTGSLYRWIRQQVATDNISYNDMEKAASAVPVGSDGLRVIPFGNGAERMLNNRNIGSQIVNLQFNRHTRSHLYRAALEGIAFSFVYGIKILNEIGIRSHVIRVGNDNLFQSEIFATTVSALTKCKIEVIGTTGAAGAALGAGIGVGRYENTQQAFGKIEVKDVIDKQDLKGSYSIAYKNWTKDLGKLIID
ncbi:xylulokinase [Marinigracilibium pacificum]|uniref:Carbohydrate kinase n=1 Tax=Marinigracilibium pacificum TaxID=2729599 RepID=A0A848IWK6_9BACT|nr:FGGY family carbohydrate kinase [Marinigracilibium pacificum]NMM47548.1 carbohydrate kinase [Marinigracilibium pacificum]